MDKKETVDTDVYRLFLPNVTLNEHIAPLHREQSRAASGLR
ncbi:hypothetical protein LMG24235_06872 [Paraburkholderia sabiae]|nr:hypothetical protein LMG24235_06872 [Paraburkholderia sabiae]